MIKPYYESGGITIYNGRVEDVLPGLEASSVDVVLTDPPYNVGKDYGEHNDSMSPEDYGAWMAEVLSQLGRVSKDSVIFFPGTTNVFKASSWLRDPLQFHRLLGWHKKEFAGDKWTGGPAMCWEPIVWASKGEKPSFNKVYGIGGRDFLVVPSTHGNPYHKVHPCPKPLPVMQWLVGLFAPEGGLVLDGFSGTGTTLRAAKDLGRRAIGIEREERFCEVAATRMSQEVLFGRA